MIRTRQYFTNPTTLEYKKHPKRFDADAQDLLDRVNRMCNELGWTWPKDPDTGSCISGVRRGAGDGGFRAEDSKTGAAGSSHRKAKGVDVYDPNNVLEGKITDQILRRYRLYREHPDATPGWVHLQSVAPRSGKHTYIP